MTRYEIMQMIEDEDVEFIRLQFVDMFGNLKNIAVTPGQMDRVLNNEYFVQGSALYDDLYPLEEDLFLHPDLDSFVILPWRPQNGRVAKFICDVCDENGNPYEMSPRTILKKTLRKINEKGYNCIVDAECEFFLFHTDDNGMPTVVSHEKAGYLDVGPSDFGENARREIVLNLEEMGFEIESSHHEKSPAQHEIDFREGEGLKTADALTTFKFAVRSIAKRFGLYATFMPKPKSSAEGSGLHLHFSVFKAGENIFEKEDKQEAKYFIGGIMKHVKAICAVTNPTINSYKRLISMFSSHIGWACKGERTIIKLRKTFGTNKVEVRFPDSAANPYSALALCVAAGIQGIEDKTDPDVLLEQMQNLDKKLPNNLYEALYALKRDDFLKEILGEEFIRVYTAVKDEEWHDYMCQVSDWELEKYLSKL